MKATKREFLVTIEGVPGNWKGFSGGDGTSSPTKDWDGGAERPDLLAGPTEFSDIEVTRTYDPAKDQAWVSDGIAKIGRGRYTVTKQAIDANYIKVGKPRTYPDCLLIGVSESEVDASSSDAAEVTFTFATAGPA
jgi:hypothetical protein